MTREPRPELLDVLEGRADASAVYAGALRAFSDVDNPARIRLAAGALRELLDELQERDAGLVRRGKRLGDRIKDLEHEWESVRPLASGDVEVFERKLAAFFKGVRSDFVDQRKKAELMLVKLDPAHRDDVPPPIMDTRVRKWLEFREFFSLVLHGRTRPTPEAFADRITELEHFLVSWFRPAPLEGLAQLDRILAEGPPDA